jgi:chromosome segregation ATPase
MISQEIQAVISNITALRLEVSQAITIAPLQAQIVELKADLATAQADLAQAKQDHAEEVAALQQALEAPVSSAGSDTTVSGADAPADAVAGASTPVTSPTEDTVAPVVDGGEVVNPEADQPIEVPAPVSSNNAFVDSVVNA